MKKRTARGVTLLELVITISIVSILLAVGVPSFRDFMVSRAVSSHVSALAGSIRLARSEAIKRSAPVALCRTDDPMAGNPACNNGDGGDWSTGWIMFVDRDADGTIDDGEFVIQIQQAYDNSGGIVRSGGANTILFQPSGISTNAQGNFLFRPKLDSSYSSYASLSNRMCVSSSGTTRLIHGDGACS